MEAGKRNIPEIFNRANKLKVPHFQRSYVWDEEQWDRFLDDMEYASRTNQNYFMGSIILKQKETPSNTENIRVIIDGQQRITTFILFFKALFNKHHTPDKFFNIFTMFDESIILDHNYSDKAVFEKIFFDKELEEKEKRSRIYKCYEYFLTHLEENEINPNSLFSRILFVGIDINQNEDEQQVFDTINSLGVRLTTAELLKNYLFKEDIDLYNRNWRDVFEKEDETKGYWEQEVTAGRYIRSNIDLFLQSYLFIKIQDKDIDVSAEDKERYFKIDSVFNSYKEFIKKYNIGPDQVISELKDYALIYRNILNPQIVEQDIDKNNYEQRLNLVIFGLETATIIPYVLYIAKKVTDKEEKNKIYRYLETYLMRRIICKETAKNYNQLFRSFINNEIDSLEKIKNIIEDKSDRINKIPSDEDLKEGFVSSILVNKQVKGILYLIERTIRSPLNSTELKYFNEYSLEHVMPKKWRNNWDSNKLDDFQAEKRDKILLTLGNLTLLTKQLNSIIRDADWQTKKNGNQKNHGLNEYAQGIEIFSKYLKRDTWDENTITERAQELFDLSINKVWNLDFY